MSVKKVINFFIIFLLLFSFASCSFFNDTHIYNTANETQSNATNSTYTVNYTETTITTKKVLSNERAEYEKAIINIFTPDNQINNNDKVLRWKTNIKIKLIGEYSDKDKEIIRYLINRVNYYETVPSISFAKKGEAANFVMAFGSDSYLNSHYPSMNYMYNHKCIVASNNLKTIEHVTTFVKTQSNNIKQNKYIARVFLEGLGIGKYESKVDNIDSVFNENAETYYFSEFDNLLISLYYASNIKEGINIFEALDLFKDTLTNRYEFTTTTTTIPTTTFGFSPSHSTSQ